MKNENKYHKLPVEKLRSFLNSAFLTLGFREEDAATAAKVLLMADLRGIDSHGVARLKGYIRQINEGRIEPSAKGKYIHETPSTATLDAEKSLGLISAQKGMNYAIEKAREVGSGWVAIKNSSHFGIAAAHTLLALEEDMIGFAITNASPLVAPSGSTEGMLGTNPICMSIPAGKKSAFTLDMATSAVANGKLEIASRENHEIPHGLVQKKNGEPSSDPNELKSSGTLLPLGSDEDHSYHKGYGLSAMVDILSGVLGGASFGPWVPPFVSFLNAEKQDPKIGEGIGHFVGAWRVDAFRPKDEFKNAMDIWIERFKEANPKVSGQRVLIPGEPELQKESERRKNGIPVIDAVYKDMLKIESELNLNIL